MNERILELAKQAAAIEGWGPEVWQTTFSEKFAELIVKECAAHLHRRGIEGFGILEERNLKEHFGVE